PDAAPLLAEVEERAGAQAAELLERRGELVAAVTAERAQHVAGEALGVDARGNVVEVAHLAAHDGDVLVAVAVGRERRDTEAAEPGGEVGDGDQVDRVLVGAGGGRRGVGVPGASGLHVRVSPGKGREPAWMRPWRRRLG